ncbi:tetraacyldisaccharide 4'-kinase [Thermodesulfobacteriota bacterium]
MRKPDWPNIHEEKRFNAMTLPLALLSLLYGLAIRLRLIIGKKKQKSALPGFVLSIGNLTVGGTGKTPAACMLADWALGEGHNVAVLSRGYGGSYKTKVFVVSDGHDIKAGPERVGDEPFLLARRLRGVPVIISKNRYQAGLIAHKKFGSSFFILDDGFQHQSLKRDFDIVLIDASTPFGNGHLLPWGPLREPVEQLSRADTIILTRSGRTSPEYNLDKVLREKSQGKPLFRGDHIPEKVVFPFKDITYDPGFLKGKSVMAFAGIARPELFKNSLVNLGAHLVSFRSFRDHHPFCPGEIRELDKEKKETGADYLITTEKDWVRLENIVPDYPELAYLKIRFTLLSEQEHFFRVIKERIAKRDY